MPEYLAPGVYVEEIDIGVRPIEGVSTSTAGMVGTTERGPVDVPMLVTSFGEFERLFGGYLDFGVYGDHAHLPHAVEGFFQNGGKRLYVTRVVADQPANPATHAGVTLFDRGERSGVADSHLAKHARAGDGLVLVESAAGLADGDAMRFGDGGTVEYAELENPGAVIAAAGRTLALHVPLYQGFDPAGPTTVTKFTLDDTVNPFPSQLVGDHAAGATILALDPAQPPNAATVVGATLRIGAGATTEYLPIAEVMNDPAAPRVRLAFPLGRDHAALEPVARVDETLPGAPTNVSTTTAAGDGLLLVAAAAGFAAGDTVRLTDGTRTEFHQLAAFAPFALDLPTQASHRQGEPVRVLAFPGLPVHNTTLAAAAPVGERTLRLDAVGPLAVGGFVRLGPVGPGSEVHEITAILGATITLRQGVAIARAAGTALAGLPAPAGGAASRLAQDLAAGETALFAADAGLAANDLLEIGPTGGATTEYRTLGASAVALLDLDAPLGHDQARGGLVGRRDALLDVQALDAGPWGNELSVTAEDDSLATTLVTANALPGQSVTLASAAGIEIGTVLDFGGRLAKVIAPPQGTIVTLQPAGAPFGVALGDPVRTREFRLRTEWRRNGRTLKDETLRYLSLDPRHSRYVETVAGAMAGPLRPSDRRPEGQSDFLRVTDTATPAQAEAWIRLGPDALTELGPGGRPRVAGRLLTGGANPPVGLTAATYIGQDDPDPALRTGLASLRNERRISIVAIPGQTGADVQQALVTHCENERFRFAVLDSTPGADRSQGAPLPDVITHRNQYDSRYAALYYPWLVVRNPFGNQPGVPLELAVPPAGHVVGLYARTDVERGVHKAPANVVIRGIRSLQRRLNQSEQDVLNPSPTNVNVLRDFRDTGRGLRVWGARCITSDTDWKYVNVRRLFLFLEQSLYEGTQWAVFEPNDRPLWDRVRQSVGAFLTRVWRDGALQGASPEEAFFVRCDRTTMTQDDIDNGRLIVLVGVAPVKPAEFVILRIFQTTIEAASA